jgi:hypothetical protein
MERCSLTELSYRRKQSPVRCSPAMAEMWCKSKRYCTTGLCPFAGQVCIRVGRCENPDSSMKTISRPFRRVFLSRGQVRFFQSSIATSSRSRAWRSGFWRADSHLPQQTPDMRFAVPHPELALDEHAHPLECP